MPIYEYLCNDCGERFEQVVMSKSQAIACPKCSSEKHTLQLSVFAAPANGDKSSAGTSPSGGSCGCTPHSCGCH